jgi:hypothetical protein
MWKKGSPATVGYRTAINSISKAARDLSTLPATPAECWGTFLLGLGFTFVTAADAIFNGLGGLVIKDNIVTERPVAQ